MGLAGAGAADQHQVALLSQEAAAGQILHQGLVDRRAFELEVRQVLGQGQLGGGELILDGSGLLLGDLGLEQVADDAGRLVLALHGMAHHLVERCAHAVELERAHQVEDMGAFHGGLLRRS